METVALVILLILALVLIGVVLVQRSEGGGLGMGGGGGGGVMSSRSAATALTKLTWVLGVAFMCFALAMTIIAAKDSAGSSVVDRISAQPAPAEDSAPTLADDENLLPPSLDESEPLLPQAN